MKQVGINRQLLWVLVLMLIFSSFSSLAVFADSHGEETLMILHTNDLHGRILEGDYDGMGFGKLASHVNEFREMYENLLLLDAGDTLHGLPIVTLVEGESMIQVMNAMGYDAMAAGNHDFNYGQPRLLELAELAEFPILAANVYREDGSRLLEPYVIKEMDGFTVGIFGLATPETLWKSHPLHVGGLTFADPVVEARAMVDLLEDEVDVIIAVGHLGIDEETAPGERSTAVAEAVEGLHLFVDGHSHTVMEAGMLVGDTLIVSAGYYGMNLGVVEVTMMNGVVIDISARLITKEVSEEVAEDPVIMALVEALDERQQEAMSEVLGETTVELEGARELVRTGETNFGNLLNDILLDVSGADLALSNGGNIRATLPPGPITRGDVIAAFPFGNLIEVKEVTGSLMKAILEHGTSAYPEPAGGFPHVGGMTYQIDLSRPVGDRIINMMVGDEPMDMEATFLLVTNDFLAAGGDGYTMLAELPTHRRMMAMDEAVVEYLREVGTVAPVMEGRITVVGELPEAVEVEEEEEVMEEMPEMVPAYGVHVVQPGEVLWRIARMHGTTWEFLAELNEMANPHLIFPGQEVLYPVQ